MVTTLRQTVTAVRHRPAKERVRLGFNGARSSADQLVASCTKCQDQVLLARATALLEAVSSPLRSTAQQVLVHPTLQTLKESFDAADAVLVMCAQLARRARRLQEAEAQVRVAVLLAGFRAGIAELELGLENIPLLPSNVSEYPEDA